MAQKNYNDASTLQGFLNEGILLRKGCLSLRVGYDLHGVGLSISEPSLLCVYNGWFAELWPNVKKRKVSAPFK